MRRIISGLAAGLLLALVIPAHGQTLICFKSATGSGCTPVSSGAPLPVAATLTPSGTQNVNLTQILGAAPSLTNPLWVFPATGATFPVSGTFWQATQPVSVATLPALPANQSVNLTQIAGSAPGPTAIANSISVIPSSQYPANATAAATPITISATGTTGATAATLAATTSKTTFICGFSITSDAVAGLSGNATIAGVVTGTMTYIQGVGVAPAVVATSQTFNPCIPASAANTTIVVTSAAAGTGGTTAVNAWGYQL